MLGIDKLLTAFLLVPAAHSVAHSAGYEKVYHGHVLTDSDIRVGLHLGYEELRDIPARGVSASMEYALPVVASFQAERELAVLGVELHALADYLLDALRALLHQHLHRLVLAQAAAGYHRIGKMYLRIVLYVRHCGYAALGIVRVAVPQSLLRDHQYRAQSRCLMSDIQPGQSAAYDQIFPHLTRIYVLIKMSLRGSRRAAPRYAL